MATVVTEAVAATVGHTVVIALEEGVVGSGALVAETAAEAQTVEATLYDLVEAAPAPQSAVVEVVFVSALVGDVVTAGEIVAVLVPAAAEFVLGTLGVVTAVAAVVLPAASVVPVVQAALPAVAVELPVPAAVMQAVAVAVVVVVVVGLVWPPG